MVSNELSDLFFHDLKQYNNTNFRTLANLNLDNAGPELYKSCSSVVTRYFIFAEKHPEISDTDMLMLYYKLNIDRIAKYFSEYPSPSKEDLIPFQKELQRYVQSNKEEVGEQNVISAV